ncbi:hypothetical protein EDB80DRAFT_781910 [Ilyonectria destructans]|nr:hypothetical protein EDB80DRAFT_781910 [Ilyonectria destructans]
MNASSTKLVEQLFLDYSLHDVINTRCPTGDPWATMYVDAVREERFGDAVWARYHMDVQIEDGIIKGSPNLTVMESIKEDAIGYKVNAPKQYAEALLFYAKASSADGHPDVIEIIFQADSEDAAGSEDDENEINEYHEDEEDEGEDVAGRKVSESN